MQREYETWPCQWKIGNPIVTLPFSLYDMLTIFLFEFVGCKYQVVSGGWDWDIGVFSWSECSSFVLSMFVVKPSSAWATLIDRMVSIYLDMNIRPSISFNLAYIYCLLTSSDCHLSKN